MQIYNDLTKFDADQSDLKKSLFYTTLIHVGIRLLHISILVVVIGVLIYFLVVPELDMSPAVFAALSVGIFIIFIMLSLWLHYHLKLQFSQYFKAEITLPVLHQLFKSTIYSQTCDCEKIIRMPGFLHNNWRSVRINDYFDGYSEDYDRHFEFFDFQLFMADGGEKSAIYKGHLLVIEMPWRLEHVDCALFHENIFHGGKNSIRSFPAFEVPEFAQKFGATSDETRFDGATYQTQKQISFQTPPSEPEAKPQTKPAKRKPKVQISEDNLIGEFESKQKILTAQATAPNNDEVQPEPSFHAMPAPQQDDNTQSFASLYAQKPQIQLANILSRSFAENILHAEERLGKDLYIYIQGDRMFVNVKSHADILEPHPFDFARTAEKLEKRIIQELLPIVDMISVSQS